MAARIDSQSELLTCGVCNGVTASPLALESGPDGRALITRRCTRCHAVDVIACDAAVALEWLRNGTRGVAQGPERAVADEVPPRSGAGTRTGQPRRATGADAHCDAPSRRP